MALNDLPGEIRLNKNIINKPGAESLHNLMKRNVTWTWSELVSGLVLVT